MGWVTGTYLNGGQRPDRYPPTDQHWLELQRRLGDGLVGRPGGVLSSWAALPVWIRLSELFCVLFSNKCNAINIFHFQKFALLSVVCMMEVF